MRTSGSSLPFRQFTDLPGHDVVVFLVAVSRTRLAGRDIAGDLAFGDSAAFGLFLCSFSFSFALCLPIRQVFIRCPVAVDPSFPFFAGSDSRVQQDLVNAVQYGLDPGKLPLLPFFDTCLLRKFRLPFESVFDSGIFGFTGCFLPCGRLTLFRTLRKALIFDAVLL